MFFYSFQINALKTYVVENKFERRSAQWVPIDDSERVEEHFEWKQISAVDCIACIYLRCRWRSNYKRKWLRVTTGKRNATEVYRGITTLSFFFAH
jgi:hypothetical protein